MTPGKPQSFTVFVARRSGARHSGATSIGTKPLALRFYRRLFALATRPVAHGDDALELAQLALRRCVYLLGEMVRSQRRAPEGASLLARSAIETALIGAYLAVTPDAPDRFVKRQSRHSARLRERLLAGDNGAVLTLLADAEFIAGPLTSGLGSVKAAPDLAQIARRLDDHPPFETWGLASLLYDEAYSFLSNFVEHPTPLSLERHRRISAFRHGARRFSPSASMHHMSLATTAIPAVAGLAACLAQRCQEDTSVFEMCMKDAAFADGYFWSGSPLRMAAATSIVESVGLTRLRADAVGYLLRALAAGDAIHRVAQAEQLVVALEAVDRGRHSRTPLHVFRRKVGHRPSHHADWRDVPAAELGNHAEVAVAALFLAYAGVWPSETAQLGLVLAEASADAHSVEQGVLMRIIGARRPAYRVAIQRMVARAKAFE